MNTVSTESCMKLNDNLFYCLIQKDSEKIYKEIIAKILIIVKIICFEKRLKKLDTSGANYYIHKRRYKGGQ